jgi:hypothetical protein
MSAARYPVEAQAATLARRAELVDRIIFAVALAGLATWVGFEAGQRTGPAGASALIAPATPGSLCPPSDAYVSIMEHRWSVEAKIVDVECIAIPRVL